MPTVRPPSRTHRNIARDLRFSISSKSMARSLGFSAAVNASTKNSASTPSLPLSVSGLQAPSWASWRPDNLAVLPGIPPPLHRAAPVAQAHHPDEAIPSALVPAVEGRAAMAKLDSFDWQTSGPAGSPHRGDAIARAGEWD